MTKNGCDSMCLAVQDLGRLAYGPALQAQRALNDAVIARDAPPTLLLVEHEPVITITPRRNAAAHLLADAAQLDRLGIAVAETDRGGDITYHGPGQLVAYPILRLADFSLNLSRYMRLLESVVLDLAARFGVHGHTEPGAAGVWVHRDGQPPAKLCAMGVRIRRNVTMHGLALNVNPNLRHFQTIVPCGYADRGVTSLAELLGPDHPEMPDVKTALVDTINKHLQARQQYENVGK